MGAHKTSNTRRARRFSCSPSCTYTLASSIMASRRSSKSLEAQAKMLKMVNDQRARCKFTTLDSVLDDTGFSWVESMIEKAREVYRDHK